MPRQCELTKKRTVYGNNVSHSHRKTRRKFQPNLQKKRIYIPELKKWVRLTLSTRAIRTLQKTNNYSSIINRK